MLLFDNGSPVPDVNHMEMPIEDFTCPRLVFELAAKEAFKGLFKLIRISWYYSQSKPKVYIPPNYRRIRMAAPCIDLMHLRIECLIHAMMLATERDNLVSASRLDKFSNLPALLTGGVHGFLEERC